MNDKGAEAKVAIQKISLTKECSISDEMIVRVNLTGDHFENSEWSKDMLKYRRIAIMFALMDVLWFTQNFGYTGATTFAAIFQKLLDDDENQFHHRRRCCGGI